MVWLKHNHLILLLTGILTSCNSYEKIYFEVTVMDVIIRLAGNNAENVTFVYPY